MRLSVCRTDLLPLFESLRAEDSTDARSLKEILSATRRGPGSMACRARRYVGRQLTPTYFFFIFRAARNSLSILVLNSGVITSTPHDATRFP